MKKILFISTIFIYLSCGNEAKKDTATVVTEVEPLSSFNKGDAKTNIITFVEKITDSTHTDYVKPEDRIACFDNDGTLWVEQPLPSQLFFAFDRIKEIAAEHPEWKDTMPFKAIIEGDSVAMKKFGKEDLLQLVGEAHAIQNVDQYDSIVQNWLDTAKHPVLKKPYTQLVYQPMLELLDYLRTKQFKIYIISGGSQEFMRVWASEVYGIPKENIIGSTFKREVVMEGDSLSIAQNAQFEFNDDHEGKVIAINKFIGKKPIMVVGNSDGDLEMMEYSDTDNPLPHFLLYVNHTDGDREFLYDEHVHLGALKKGMEVAKERGWTIIDMKKDWKTVFPN